LISLCHHILVKRTMADLTIRGVSDAVYEALKEEAERNRRSLNQEVVRRLEASVPAPRADPKAELERVRALRGRLADLPPLDDELLAEARRRGRP